MYFESRVRGEKGSFPFFFVRSAMIPDGILMVGTGAVFGNLSKVLMDAFAVPVGEIYITASRESAFGQSIYVSRRWRQ